MITRRFEIDYGWSVATFYSPVEPDEAISQFMKRANVCFGIRKCITKDPVVKSFTEEPIPAPWGELTGAFEMLEHNKPLGDVIVWDKEGNKIKSEWDD